jgi:hypothetical protein
MAWYARPLQPDDIESQRGLPLPRFRLGEVVRSVVGVDGGSGVRTVVTGPVAWYSWHWKRNTWMYRLTLPDRRRNRRYFECELVAAAEAD